MTEAQPCELDLSFPPTSTLLPSTTPSAVAAVSSLDLSSRSLDLTSTTTALKVAENAQVRAQDDVARPEGWSSLSLSPLNDLPILSLKQCPSEVVSIKTG